jgi:hypothetical protein
MTRLKTLAFLILVVTACLGKCPATVKADALVPPPAETTPTPTVTSASPVAASVDDTSFTPDLLGLLGIACVAVAGGSLLALSRIRSARRQVLPDGEKSEDSSDRSRSPEDRA